MRIVIVDDAAIMRMRLRDLLEKDHEVVGEAANGEEAIAVCQELSPDLVTLDISMPEVDGLKALPEILKLPRAPRVIIISAVGQKQLVHQALEDGATDFVTKPYEVARVQKAVQRVADLLK
ncbi:MAG: response regulator [Actinobacteria bacterium]|nr:response regulator [Actinomycetota bacterium]